MNPKRQDAVCQNYATSLKLTNNCTNTGTEKPQIDPQSDLPPFTTGQSFSVSLQTIKITLSLILQVSILDVR